MILLFHKYQCIYTNLDGTGQSLDVTFNASRDMRAAAGMDTMIAILQ